MGAMMKTSASCDLRRGVTVSMLFPRGKRRYRILSWSETRYQALAIPAFDTSKHARW